MRSIVGDYYELLGVDPSIGQAELRRAWRRLALRWHPDRAGTESTATFQKLAAAYAVLSDPVARGAYDSTRRGVEVSGEGRSDEPPRSRAAPSRRVPAVMLSRITGPLESLLACGSARCIGPDVIELYVDEAESSQGGMAMISMDVDIRCPDCAAQTRAASCARCAGTGKVQERFSAWLAVPPGVVDGTILKPSVELPGMIAPLSFRVRSGSRL